jgi:hypothetical protein
MFGGGGPWFKSLQGKWLHPQVFLYVMSEPSNKSKPLVLYLSQQSILSFLISFNDKSVQQMQSTEGN